MAIETANTHTQIFALDSLASFAAEVEPTAAVRLCSAATTLREAHGGGWTLETFGIDCARTAAGAILSDGEIEVAWGAGSSWELAEAIRSARLILRSARVDSNGHG